MATTIHNDTGTDTNSTNTMLVVVLLVVVVGAVVWYMTALRSPTPASTTPNRDVNVDVQLPDLGTPQNNGNNTGNNTGNNAGTPQPDSGQGATPQTNPTGY